MESIYMAVYNLAGSRVSGASRRDDSAGREVSFAAGGGAGSRL